MIGTAFPILSALIALPIGGALLCMCVRENLWVKWLGLTIAVTELLIAILAVYWYDSSAENNFQLIESYSWIPSLNIHYDVGVDGISVLFLPVTALLTVFSILAGWNSISYLSRFHLALLFMLEGLTLGIFVAIDLMLFFFFWEDF